MPNDETTSTRDILSAAYDRIDSGTTDATPPPAPVVTTTTAAPEPEPAAAASEAHDTRTAAERARDEKGRFAPKPSEKPAVPDLTAKKPPDAGQTKAEGAKATAPVPSAAVVPEPPKFKPPAAWRPGAREKWAALPPEVQEEIAKREGEVPRALQEASEAKRFRDTFNEAVRPYEAMIRANGHEPMQTVQSLMQTAAALQFGDQTQKARVAAQILQGYGIDLEQVNGFLSGQQPMPQAQQRPPPPPVDVRGELQRYVREIQQQHLQTETERAVSEAREASEFWGDIGEPKIRAMASALVEADGSLTAKVALTQAYEILAARDPHLSGILKQREAAAAAAKAQASTQQAMRAASSVRSQPTAAPAAQPVGRRAVLEAKFDEITSR
jgi:hypothetical protein